MNRFEKMGVPSADAVRALAAFDDALDVPIGWEI
jgi:hypothetical protein